MIFIEMWALYARSPPEHYIYIVQDTHEATITAIIKLVIIISIDIMKFKSPNILI